jgi:hypothetical protein
VICAKIVITKDVWIFDTCSNRLVVGYRFLKSMIGVQFSIRAPRDLNTDGQCDRLKSDKNLFDPDRSHEGKMWVQIPL